MEGNWTEQHHVGPSVIFSLGELRQRNTLSQQKRYTANRKPCIARLDGEHRIRLEIAPSSPFLSMIA